MFNEKLIHRMLPYHASYQSAIVGVRQFFASTMTSWASGVGWQVPHLKWLVPPPFFPGLRRVYHSYIILLITSWFCRSQFGVLVWIPCRDFLLWVQQCQQKLIEEAQQVEIDRFQGHRVQWTTKTYKANKQPIWRGWHMLAQLIFWTDPGFLAQGAMTMAPKELAL